LLCNHLYNAFFDITHRRSTPCKGSGAFLAPRPDGIKATFAVARSAFYPTETKLLVPC